MALLTTFRYRDLEPLAGLFELSPRKPENFANEGGRQFAILQRKRIESRFLGMRCIAQQLKANGPDDYSQEDPNNSYLISTLNEQAARQYLRSGTFKMPT